jgi:hypothetical protein
MPPIDCLIPAQPGTYVLIGTLEAEQFAVARINVIAWAATNGEIIPVTMAGLRHGQETIPAVLQPDGTVEEADGALFANPDEWRRTAVKRARSAEILAG